MKSTYLVWRKRVGYALAPCAALAIIAGTIWASGSAIVDAYRTSEMDAARRHSLIEAGKRSEAHGYFVHHWLQCGAARQAACLASIRTAAAVRGPDFSRQIDAIALELGLA